MPLDPDAEWKYWDDKAAELYRTQRDTVSASAAKWTALQTAILGVFTAVAFAGGLTTLDKLGEPWHWIALGITILAVLTGLTAIVLMNFAGGGLFTKVITQPLDGMKVKQDFAEAALVKNQYLRNAQKASIATVCLFIIGAFMVLIVGPADPPQHYIATFSDKGPVYGVLSVDKDHILYVGGQQLDKALQVLTPVSAQEIETGPPAE
jgi:hypothetical protein